jgi:hypothetical protein
MARTRAQIVANEQAAKERREKQSAIMTELLTVLNSWSRSTITPIPGNPELSVDRLGGVRVSHADEFIKRKKILPTKPVEVVDEVVGEVVEVKV